jgi:hypothetical protein
MIEPTACLFPAYTQKAFLLAFPTGTLEIGFILFGAEILLMKSISLSLWFFIAFFLSNNIASYLF